MARERIASFLTGERWRVRVVRAKPSGASSPQWRESSGRVTRRTVKATVVATTSATAIVGGTTAGEVALRVHGGVGE